MPGARWRRRPVGLHWRLAGWVALVTLACTGIAFVAVYGGTAADLRRQIDSDLRGDAGELAATISRVHATSASEIADAAKDFVHDQPFTATSRIVYVTIAGGPTVSNRRELFGPAADDVRESAFQEIRERQIGAQLLATKVGFTTTHLPTVGEFRVLRMRARAQGGAGATIGVGETLSTVDRAQRGVARAFILGGLLALAGALLAAYLVGRRVSQPLRRMADVAARVDAGDLHPRIEDPGGLGDEVKVLAEAFNHMLDRLTTAFAGQQAFIADASHELRTPLTVIRGQIEVLAAQPNPPAAEVRRVERLVQAEIARVSRLVDDLLLLAKSEHTEFLQPAAIELPTFVRELWDGVSLLAERDFELDEVPPGTLVADPDRLAQALRNLLGNAIDHTAPEHGLVRLRVLAAPRGRIRFVIDDDGPGIPPDQLERVFARFHRTDSGRTRSGGGTGLGLAIVRAIADAHGGSVSASASPEGGARFVLELPGFQPAPVSPRPAARAQAGTVAA
jgi:two-component system, OmpR family, sensor kinase